MAQLWKLRGVMMARIAGVLLSAACVIHAKKPVADSAAHPLRPAGHAPPPGLTLVVLR